MPTRTRPHPDPLDQHQIDLVQFGVMQLMDALGLDWMKDPELKDTPQRVARFYQDFLDYRDDNHDTTFDTPEHQIDQMVAVTGIEVWSLCAHHLLPFSATITCAYIAKDKVLGLSKMPRMAHQAAHKLQTQERLTSDIAEAMTAVLGHDDVGVVAEGTHLCVSMRGIRTPSVMRTNDLRGAFLNQPATRAELMALLR